MSRYYTEPKLNATGGGGSSLTIREADGTPSGVVTELVFPNTSISIAGGVGTLSVVPAFSTNVTGDTNTLEVTPPADASDFARFNFISHSGPTLDDFGLVKLSADPEEGVLIYAQQNGLGSQQYALSVTPSGFVVQGQSNFRTAIDAAAASHTHGNISNAGAIGTTADLPVITGASGVLQAGSFGTTANTFCQGNDARLSDARTPLAHNQAWSTITATPTTLAGYGITDGQSTLVSGTSIRTINGNSLLGSGDLTISGLSAIASQTILGNNTGGSAVPTGLTASDVRTLLGLATTDSPTFAGVTLGTSGILVGGTNRIEQRNGTNAQILEIAKTWTSTTVFEELTFDASSDASNYRIGSRIGSAGGTTRGLQLGRYDAAGAWTSWLGIDASGLAASNLYGTGSPNGGVAIRTTAASSNYVEAIGSSVFVVNTNNITAAINRSSTKSIATTSDGFFAFGPSTTNANGFGAVATLSQSSGIIIASGGFTFTPPASVTPSTNGQFSIEMTSNTAGNLVYRGSDGTTRRMALTFS